MTEQRTPTFTVSQRLSNTHFKVNVYCKADAEVTYEDKLLELIRSGMLTEQEHPELPHTEQVA